MAEMFGKGVIERLIAAVVTQPLFVPIPVT
jgi:hypothetical protein